MHLKLKLTLTAALAAVAATSFAQDTQVIKLGHVGPVSGPQAHYGRDNENGARMAVEELNTQNVVINGKKIKWELQAEDDAADPKQGTAAAQKLCDAKVAGVVGHLNSGTTLPASKVYNDCGIPHVTGSATNPLLMKPGYNTTFRIISNDNALGSALALYATDTLKLKKIAVIDDRTAYGQGVASVFKKAVAVKGAEVVAEPFTTDQATDFMAILMPGGEAWKKRYDAKFPGQFQIYSPYTYDATMLLADAMKRANSWDPKVYIPALLKSNYSGVTATIAFEPNGELKNPSSTLYNYKDGKRTPL